MLDNCGLKIEIVVGDLDDQDFLNAAMQDVTTVLHIAAIFFSRKVVKAAIDNNVDRMILVHTTGIYSKFKSASEDYKNIESDIQRAMEAGKLQTGLVYLRPTMIYGNVNDKNMIIFIKMVDRLRLFPVVDHGKNLLQPVNGKDLGKAYYQVLSKSEIVNGDYILSGEGALTMLEVFQTISRQLGKRTIYLSVPLVMGVLMAKILKAFSLGTIDYVEKVQRMGENRSFPHDAAARDFGYSPMPFEAGLRGEIEQYLNSKQLDS
jgi:nucleoside-diphosphate-sugar epimerase